MSACNAADAAAEITAATAAAGNVACSCCETGVTSFFGDAAAMAADAAADADADAAADADADAAADADADTAADVAAMVADENAA